MNPTLNLNMQFQVHLQKLKILEYLLIFLLIHHEDFLHKVAQESYSL